MTRPCGGCDKVATCRFCYLFHTDPAYRAFWGDTSLPVTAPPPGQCVHRGGTLRLQQCGSCAGGVKAKVCECVLHGECTQFAKPIPGVKSCTGCADQTSADPIRRANALTPERGVRVDLPGHFNCSIHEHGGRLLLASRRGWTGAEIHVSDLGDDFRPRRTTRLGITHPDAPSGVEDPRLFTFRDRLHCAFIGLDGTGPARRIHQMVCRLGGDFSVEDVWMPEYAGRRGWEKNWQFFEHGNELLSVYSVDPHVVLGHDGRRAEEVGRTEHAFRWKGHYLRGGCPPVRVGDEYYHFFHSLIDHGGAYDYHMGLYTFGAKRPFAIRRFTPLPILSPDADRPPEMDKSVVFPCGAILRNGKWIISYGYHDRECRLAWFDAGVIESRLKPLEYR